MKYENGGDIFPEPLLKQIQKYVCGKLIYIPSDGKKRPWGETSGYKQYLLERNRDIRDKFNEGTIIEVLSEEYFLSCETIKKIVYSKEAFILRYKCTLSSAQEYAKEDKIENWIHQYLLSDGHNKEFSDGLKLFDRYFIGPIKMPLTLFCRCCGPEENMKYRVNAEWFEKHVAKLENVLKTIDDIPPMIANYVDGHFELNDGNHRLEAYKRLGVEEYYMIIWITEKSDYETFLSQYQKYLML
jgi:ParB-like nuclease domain.